MKVWPLPMILFQNVPKTKQALQQVSCFRRGGTLAHYCLTLLPENWAILQVGKYKVDNFGAVRMSLTQLLQQRDAATPAVIV